jgi:hypothetical protein
MTPEDPGPARYQQHKLLGLMMIENLQMDIPGRISAE